jgi:hypothetical protein
VHRIKRGEKRDQDALCLIDEDESDQEDLQETHDDSSKKITDTIIRFVYSETFRSGFG